MYAKCVSGEEMKRGGTEQHSKIGTVNNGEDVAEGGCVLVGETNRARMRAAVASRGCAREHGEESCGLGSHTQREIEPKCS
jgi:hypothetical protein